MSTHWRRAVTAVGVVVVVGFLAVLVLANRGEFPDAWRAVRHARLGWLAVGLAAMLASFVNLGMLHAAAQRATALDTAPTQIVAVATAGNFLNLATKSGGLGGLAPIRADARRRSLPQPAVTAAYLLVVMMGEWTFAVTLLLTLVIMWSSGTLFTGEILASVAFAVIALVKLVAVIAAWRSRRALRAMYAVPHRLFAWIRRKPTPAVDTTAADEFCDALDIIRLRPGRCVVVACHAFVVEALGVVQLYAAIAAVGEGRHLTLALVAYAISVLFTIIGFLPGGLGFVEVSATATLVSYGLTGGTAAAAVVLYRVTELWLPLLIGGLLLVHLRRVSSPLDPPRRDTPRRDTPRRGPGQDAARREGPA